MTETVVRSYMIVPGRGVNRGGSRGGGTVCSHAHMSDTSASTSCQLLNLPLLTLPTLVLLKVHLRSPPPVLELLIQVPLIT